MNGFVRRFECPSVSNNLAYSPSGVPNSHLGTSLRARSAAMDEWLTHAMVPIQVMIQHHLMLTSMAYVILIKCIAHGTVWYSARSSERRDFNAALSFHLLYRFHDYACGVGASIVNPHSSITSRGAFWEHQCLSRSLWRMNVRRWGSSVIELEG